MLIRPLFVASLILVLVSACASPGETGGTAPLDVTSSAEITSEPPDGVSPEVDAVAPGCGDGSCNSGESCATCAADCGQCPDPCGDGQCRGGETCVSCALDCGACPPGCGDGSCNNGESCASCSADCGQCPPVCGDDACAGTESCTSCANDCGACPPVCGDTRCDAPSETCTTCASDCGPCEPSCEDECVPWAASCSGSNGYEVCVPDAETGCYEPGRFIGCQAGNTCAGGACAGGCVVPEVMLVVDRSSSMLGALWTFTREEVTAFAEAYEGGARVGIRTFPGAGACEPADPQALALDNADTIASALVEPATASATPIAKALDGLGELFGDPNQGELVVLMTDGSETCSEESDLFAAARVLRARGTRVMVIGLGQGYDAELLAAVAAAGGGELLGAPDRQSLRAALRALAGDATGCAQPPTGAAWCETGSCVVGTCVDGYHVCDNACVEDDDVATCGTRCAPCSPPANADATCDGLTCGFSCDAGWHACGASCASNASPLTCGSRCTPCPDDPHGSPSCNQGTCGTTCEPQYHLCNGSCASNLALATCGSRCTPCPDDPHGSPTCNGTTCGQVCDAGYHDCGGACVDDDLVATCGDRCTPCVPPANANATCDGESCGFTCKSGYSMCRGGAACCAWRHGPILASSSGPFYPARAADGTMHGVVTSGSHPRYVRWNGASWIDDGPDYGSSIVDDFVVAFDGDLPVIAWADSSSSTVSISRRSANGTWTKKSFTATGYVNVDKYALAVEASGRAHLVYQLCLTDDCGSKRLDYRSVTRTGEWSTASTFLTVQDGTYPAVALAINPAGAVCAAANAPVNGGYEMRYGCRSGSTWTLTPVPSATADGAETTQLVFDAAGNAHITYASFSGGLPVVLERLANGTWSSSDFPEAGLYLELALTPAGEVRAITTLSREVRVWRPSATTWAHQQVPFPDTFNIYRATLAFDAWGEPVVWGYDGWASNQQYGVFAMFSP